MVPLAHFWYPKYDFRRPPRHRFFDIFIKGRSVKYSKSITRNVVLGHQKALIWASIIEEFFGAGQKTVFLYILGGSERRSILEDALGLRQERDGTLKSARDHFVGKLICP